MSKGLTTAVASPFAARSNGKSPEFGPPRWNKSQGHNSTIVREQGRLVSISRRAVGLHHHPGSVVLRTRAPVLFLSRRLAPRHTIRFLATPSTFARPRYRETFNRWNNHGSRARRAGR